MPLPIYTSAAFVNDSGLSVGSNASVEVRRESDGSLVPIFEDRDGENQITQPGFQADLDGRFQFYAESDAEGWEITVAAGSDVHTLNGQFPQGGAIGADYDGDQWNFSEMPEVDGNPIVARGSNSDGEWTVWADGTQIVSQTLEIDELVLNLSPSYPQSFVDVPDWAAKSGGNDSTQGGGFGDRLRILHLVAVAAHSTGSWRVRIDAAIRDMHDNLPPSTIDPPLKLKIAAGGRRF